MTKNKLLLVSVLSALAGVSVAAAQPGAGKHFSKLDADADGVVTTTELQTGALARFDKADSDKDGKVTADELKAQHQAHMQERFSKRDSNGNGSLERAEVQKMPETFFAKIDADKSGSLSAEELAAAKQARHDKRAARGARGLPGDADNDGVLTRDEALAGVQKMTQKLDSNADGKLSQDELQKLHGGRGHGRRGERGQPQNAE